jgi:FKBP-type peptidyl-prolyl cis-trans isomerase 2
MNIIEEGDKVSIKVEAKLESGEHCFPKNKESSIELVVGDGKFFPVLENRLIKMKEGETKEITLEPNDAFGSHHNELVMDAPKSVFRSNDNLTIGMRFKIDSPSGKVYYGTITKITNEAITIDLNHPLAGKKIIFTVTIITIEKK